MTRIVFIQIQGESKSQVDRLANLVEDHSRTLVDFMLASIDVFAEEDRKPGDPPAITPEITVRNVAANIPA